MGRRDPLALTEASVGSIDGIENPSVGIELTVSMAAVLRMSVRKANTRTEGSVDMIE